jgi:acetyl-CoA acetyltransferase
MNTRRAAIVAPMRTPVGTYLLETMCVGGGQGVAAVFEAP